MGKKPPKHSYDYNWMTPEAERNLRAIRKANSEKYKKLK